MANLPSRQSALLTYHHARSHAVNVELIVRGPSVTVRMVDGPPRIQEALATIYPGEVPSDPLVASHGNGSASCPINISTDIQQLLPDVLGCIEHVVDTSAATALSGYLRLHAGVVASGGSGIIIPAQSGGGKSTLVASLCLSGFDYLSDEFALLDPCSSRVYPYSKSIGLKPPGWRLIDREYAVSTTPTTVRRPDRQDIFYLKAPAALPAGASVPIDYIIVPSRRATGRATLAERSRSETLMTLLHQTLNLPLHGTPGLEALMQMVEHAQCFTLAYATLPDAVEELTRLVHPA